MKANKDRRAQLQLAGRIIQDDKGVTVAPPPHDPLPKVTGVLAHVPHHKPADLLPILQSLADTQALLAQQCDMPKPARKTYEFTFNRDRNGFITSIIAKEI